MIWTRYMALGLYWRILRILLKRWIHSGCICICCSINVRWNYKENDLEIFFLLSQWPGMTKKVFFYSIRKPTPLSCFCNCSSEKSENKTTKNLRLPRTTANFIMGCFFLFFHFFCYPLQRLRRRLWNTLYIPFFLHGTKIKLPQGIIFQISLQFSKRFPILHNAACTSTPIRVDGLLRPPF